MTGAYMAWYGALGKEGMGGDIPREFEGEINSQAVIAVDLFCAYLHISYKVLH